MEHIAVFINDADHARRTIEPLLAPGGVPTCWLMVMCPPRLTRHAGRWTSQASRARWRADWADRLRSELLPMLPQAAAGERFEWQVARGVLWQTTQRLRSRCGAGLRVFDARRERAGVANEPLLAGAAASPGEQAAAPWLAASTLSLILALSD